MTVKLYLSVILFNLIENYINPIYPENMIFVDLKFGPKWKYISTVRTFVENFMAISLADKKKAGVIAISVNELIENAIKYSDSDDIDAVSLAFHHGVYTAIKKNDNFILRLENNIKGIISQKNFILKKQSSLFVTELFILFTVFMTILIAILWYFFPSFFSA